MSALAEALTTSERAALLECETDIERGLGVARDSLRRVRTERLYRETHATFEEYCQERWGMTRQHANRQIATAEVAEILEPIGSKPLTEGVARGLAPLREQPEALRETWAEVVHLHGEKPTAAQVREVVANMRDDGSDEELVPPTTEDVEVIRCEYNKHGYDAALQAAISLGVEMPSFDVTEERAAPDKMAVHYSSATDEWATPQDFYDVVNAEFEFDLDVCALDTSAKCDRYFTPETDGLAQEWTGTVWMNPPYGDVISQWVEKAYDSARAGATVVCLVPARSDTAWFQDFCFAGEVRFIRGRLRFGNADASAPFPSALVIFRPGAVANAYGWSWR